MTLTSSVPVSLDVHAGKISFGESVVRLLAVCNSPRDVAIQHLPEFLGGWGAKVRPHLAHSRAEATENLEVSWVDIKMAPSIARSRGYMLLVMQYSFSPSSSISLFHVGYVLC